jgi:hypothetical protein
MLSQEEIFDLKNKWFTFEEIKSINLWLDDLEKWNFLSEEEFWSQVHKDVNIKLKNQEKCIV